jgi:glyoxylase-like metal-dependent hydrolase (beta-lactamase superfamily II)
MYFSVPVTPFQQNCSVIWCDNTRKAAVVDPGGELEKILAVVETHELDLETILLTHGHIDHVGATAELMDLRQLPCIGPHSEDAFWIDNLHEQAAMMGGVAADKLSFTPSTWLNDGDSVSVGEESLDVIHCPGHTPGHVVFFHKAQELAFVGDVIFNGSIGRSDFPRGNHAQLIHSIREKLFPLGDAVRFVPGHGPESTFGVERQHNPFVADHRFG